MKNGKLFVISGPSGVGKGTMVNEVMQSACDIALSVSATTRMPREGETEGISYFFLSEEKFEEKIKQNGFLEYASVHGHYYGTPRNAVMANLDKGNDVILEIDVQGAMQVKKSFDNGIYIFVLPPSMAELHKRITERGTESQEDIELRLGKAKKEISYLDEYDYYIINDKLQNAVDVLKSIIEAEHHKISSNRNLADAYMKEC